MNEIPELTDRQLVSCRPRTISGMGSELVSDSDAERRQPSSRNVWPEPSRLPWLTGLFAVVCVAIFLGMSAQRQPDTWEVLTRFGYLPATSIWEGSYWALVSSVFVHFDPLHLAFNVYWLWVLGSRLERTIGSLRFLGFFVLSAFVSSSIELAFAGDTGIGASGVVYAMFGFMWLAGDRYPQFNSVLTSRTIQIFMFWMVGCVVATYLNIWEVGNAAHISGLVFGLAVAGFFVLPQRKLLFRAGLIALFVVSVVPLFWSPWSASWLGHKAYKAHAAKEYGVALDLYTKLLRLEPENAWAYLNRSEVYQVLGDTGRARADYQRACEIDPDLVEPE